jgi:hypothetical protein
MPRAQPSNESTSARQQDTKTARGVRRTFASTTIWHLPTALGRTGKLLIHPRVLRRTKSVDLGPTITDDPHACQASFNDLSHQAARAQWKALADSLNRMRDTACSHSLSWRDVVEGRREDRARRRPTTVALVCQRH